MYTAGVDPGLTETGMVLLSPEGHYVAGTTFKATKTGADLARIVNLAAAMVNVIQSWVSQFEIQEMLLGVEYPIVKRGAGGSVSVENYRKQINLLHEFEAGLWRWHNMNDFLRKYPMVHETPLMKVHIAEVNPTSSKLAATGKGSADKDEMIYSSPFQKRDEIKRPTREALADAWAHAIAARLVMGEGRLIELEALARERLAPQFVDTKVFKVEVR